MRSILCPNSEPCIMDGWCGIYEWI
ncbi:BgTH12-02647 [Blumeria graminis f. sp. triticale]|uniref:Bgt-50382 n=2 Tax=Blumeria graminis TaxID=34373 RepID=A0A9X9QD73_BLUGR|nr:BgTH12-02647 [Blumeria graminis f. sp. triticale]VDB88867.1 Bgt-50382 [Blumeria graminis f. sp. tritici]